MSLSLKFPIALAFNPLALICSGGPSLFKFSDALPMDLNRHSIVRPIPPTTFDVLPSIFDKFKRLWTLLKDQMLFAVPKKRVPLSRRRKRIKFQWLKPVKNIIQCKICNQPMRMHHICLNCYARYKQLVIEHKKQGLNDWDFSLFKNK